MVLPHQCANWKQNSRSLCGQTNGTRLAMGKHGQGLLRINAALNPENGTILKRSDERSWVMAW